MPPSVRIIRLFLAGPSDTAAEVGIVQSAVEDINRMHGREAGYRVELLHWKTDTFPDVGADGQDVINRQIGDYDILLAVMSTRYGSPTGRADSGTVEEFDRAWARFIQQPNSVSIMFYFRDPMVKLSAIDAYELLQIQRFQRRVRELGILHGVYDSPGELGIQLRNHLPKVIGSNLLGIPKQKPPRRNTQSAQVTEALGSWHAKQNVYPQWADRLAVPLERHSEHSYSLSGILYSESPYFRFGFRLFPREGKEWGDGMIPSREGANLLIHVGKNVESPALFLASYLNAMRQSVNIPLFDYVPARAVQIEIAISSDYVFTMKVDDREVSKMHINPTLTQRLNVVAWGDEHEFEVDFTNITLTLPARMP